ncbi:uncharacterized protein BX664DRAFT_203765 [Halteromyces radiatus]|uniref:uncharacterized protein n=1 Tax=Halteromyces radiatus TaxID=101107 RepID=UPI00221E5E60|nr:uncharacterized protein BX664DRAFT_203765 [Halteromyces radiatus]KAI8079856.1 hypothetical protein BX664DRAFT_203765 [Halteromyces radiatus]
MWFDGLRPVQALERSSERTKLTLTAVAASALTLMAVLGYQTARRQARSRHVKYNIQHEQQHVSQHINALGMIETNTTCTTNNMSTTHTSTTTQQQKEHDPTLIEEQLARNQAFLGAEGLAKIRQSHVVVVGLGSVGSWAALMLARSGVQHIRLIDPSVLVAKDLACHAAATPSTLGVPKVSALQATLSHIVPFVHIESIIGEWQPRLLGMMDPIHTSMTDNKKDGKIMVVDCLGNNSMDAKLKLIEFCHSHRIQIVSALDPGNKVDPTRIQITDISDSFDDPSAKVIRRRLKLMGIDRHLPVAYSSEKPMDPKFIKDQGIITSIEEGIPNIHVRHSPVVGSIAAMYGMALTTFILLQLADFPAYELPPIKLRDKLYTRIHQEVNKRERHYYHSPDTELNLKQVEYIYEEIWHGKSVLSGPQERITLARWDRTRPLGYLNTVCMSKEEARAHDVLPIDTNLRQYYGDDVVDYVEKQLDEEARFEKLFS